MGFLQNESNQAPCGQFSQIHLCLGYFYGSFNLYFVNCLEKNAEVNFELNGSLGLVNGRPYDGGWIEKKKT